MFFHSTPGGRRLLCFLHTPEGDPKPVGILYCHPFAEEKNLSHAISAKAARALAAEGFAVLRFDLGGCGDSEGRLEDMTVTAWLSELDAMAALLRSVANLPRVALWGLRFGASLCLSWAAGRKDVAFLILWQPVLNPRQYLRQFLRQVISAEIAGTGGGGAAPSKSAQQRIEGGETVEVLGYPISKGFLEGYQAALSDSLPAPSALPVFLATIGQSAGNGPTVAQQAVADSLRGAASLVWEHVPEPTFWDRYWVWDSPALIAATVRWAKEAAR